MKVALSSLASGDYARGSVSRRPLYIQSRGHRLCTQSLAGHLRTDSLCWARCVARTLCNRRPARLWTAAGTSCRWCRPEVPVDGRVAHGRLESSAPVDGPPVHKWFLPAPPLPCTVLWVPLLSKHRTPGSHSSPARSFRVSLLPSPVPSWSLARFSSDLVSIRHQPQAGVLAQESPHISR